MLLAPFQIEKNSLRLFTRAVRALFWHPCSSILLLVTSGLLDPEEPTDYVQGRLGMLY